MLRQGGAAIRDRPGATRLGEASRPCDGTPTASWGIDNLQPEGTLIGTISSEGYKLPDGRLVSDRMTLSGV